MNTGSTNTGSMDAVSRTRPSPGRVQPVPAAQVRFLALVSAEFHRARRTRSTLAVVALGAGIAVVMLILRGVLSRSPDTPIGAEAVTLGADLVGFAVLLAAALAVARDHHTGTIDLLRVLTPSRPRQLLARVAGLGLVALIAVGVVILAGLVTVGILNPAGLGSTLPDTVVRTGLATALFACAGAGIGALTRSTAAATFLAVALYWLIPIGLLVAGLTGTPSATPLAEATLGLLGANAIVPGAERWAAVGGIAAWSAGLAVLGMLRETSQD